MQDDSTQSIFLRDGFLNYIFKEKNLRMAEIEREVLFFSARVASWNSFIFSNSAK